MDSLKFELPVGPKADVEELLYVSALHQSNPYQNPRQDASIVSTDIARYLISRHGIEVTDEIVQDVILAGFQTNTRLDLVELVTLLCIPQFCKIADTERLWGDKVHSDKENNNESLLHHVTSPQLIEFVLKMILFDVTGDEKPKPLTQDLIRDIFAKYGEDNILLDDEMLMEMIQIAQTDDKDDNDSDISYEKEEHVMLDKKSLLRLITYDIKHFCNYSTPASNHVNDEVENTTLIKVRSNVARALKGIDYLAGTYSCKYTLVAVWVSFVFGFVGFLYPRINEVIASWITECDPFRVTDTSTETFAKFGCRIESSLLGVLVTFGFITVFGFSVLLIDQAYVEITSSKDKWMHVLITVLEIVWFVTLPWKLSKFKPDVSFIFWAQLLTYMFAIFAIKMRSKDDYKRFFLEKEKKYLEPYHTSEIHTGFLKKAALCKVKKMQENAIGLISELQKDGVIKAYFGKAIHNYSKHNDKLVPCGGFFWTWERYRSCELFHQTGIWIGARIIASQVFQVLVASMILLVGISFTSTISNLWVPVDEVGSTLVDYLSYVISTIADKGIVEDAVNNMIQRTFNYFLQFLGVLNDAGIFRFDCTKLASFLKETCSDNYCGSSSFSCNLFTVSYDDLCESLDNVYHPVIVSSEDLSFPQVFNTTSLREPMSTLISNAVSDNLITQVNKFYPESRYMITLPLSLATITGVLVSLFLALRVIPNFISTVLRLRSGIIPTMKDKKFRYYHYYVINSTKLTGASFWGKCSFYITIFQMKACHPFGQLVLTLYLHQINHFSGNVIASLSILFTVGIILFFFLWQATRSVALQLLSLLVGVIIIISILWIINRTFRNVYYSGFYRIKPLPANLFSLFNECMNIGITIFTAVSRTLILILLSEFYVGRIDVPFVANGVGDLLNDKIMLEIYYKTYLASVLAVEAHRHPYMETLGAMYLMKLRYGKKFNNKVGIAWRTIFVTAMMPWLSKYRMRESQALSLFNDDEENVNDIEESI